MDRFCDASGAWVHRDIVARIPFSFTWPKTFLTYPTLVQLLSQGSSIVASTYALASGTPEALPLSSQSHVPLLSLLAYGRSSVSLFLFAQEKGAHIFSLCIEQTPSASFLQNVAGSGPVLTSLLVPSFGIVLEALQIFSHCPLFSSSSLSSRPLRVAASSRCFSCRRPKYSILLSFPSSAELLVVVGLFFLCRPYVTKYSTH